MKGTAPTVEELRRAYEVVGIPIDSSAVAIKQGYRNRARYWHPDKWPIGSKDQETAAERMRNLNVAYDLIRHAPLRYRIESHPRVQARAERRGYSPRASIPLNDYIELATRFAVGVFIGLLIDVAVGGSVITIVAIPIATGVLFAIGGDTVWKLCLEDLLLW